MQKNESAELEAPDRANHCGYNWIDGRAKSFARLAHAVAVEDDLAHPTALLNI